jgi:hypothetical protein
VLFGTNVVASNAVGGDSEIAHFEHKSNKTKTNIFLHATIFSNVMLACAYRARCAVIMKQK